MKLRIELQEHWRLAVMVREGRQAQIDPDLEFLLEVRGDTRLYQDDLGAFVKRLIDGEWMRFEAAPP
ncbi:MAG: hypothetical protein WCJ67_11160 [Thermoleophilia bacterium]